jgi:HEAT repeat protein
MMIDEQYIDLVTAYLQDALSSEEQAELEALIGKGEINILDLKEMEMLYQKTGDIPVPEAGEGMRANFYQMLEEEKAQQRSSITERMSRFFESAAERIAWKQLAAACAVLLIGILIGNLLTPFKNYNQRIDQLGQQVNRMRQTVALNLMDDSSPVDRLKAVNISMKVQSNDQKVIDALLKTLNNDPNINVRLAAVEALVRHGNNSAARRGLIRSIDKQQSPLVQVALADAMLSLQDAHSVKAFKKLLQKDNLNPSVRKHIQHTIKLLS